MSIETPESETASLASGSAPATASENISKVKDIVTPVKTSAADEEKGKDTSKPSIYSPANLLSSLLSPFSFSSTSSEPATTTSPNNDKEKEKEREKEKTKSSTKISIEAPTSDPTQSTPEPYYTPEETPLFKTLYKTRLTKTRTKQLLRAGERAYNDPPPPPGLGDCCGSSCDPCVRDLWKQEIGIWRERWGGWGVEDGVGVSTDEKKSEKKEEKLEKRKDLEW